MVTVPSTLVFISLHNLALFKALTACIFLKKCMPVIPYHHMNTLIHMLLLVQYLLKIQPTLISQVLFILEGQHIGLQVMKD